jgi:hypothetical protein
MRRFSQQLATRGDVERGIPMQSRLAKVHPLPVDILNTYPIEKYSPSIVKNGSCAICLDDFTPEREDIRVLPCGHGFCTGCIGKFYDFPVSSSSPNNKPCCKCVTYSLTYKILPFPI